MHGLGATAAVWSNFLEELEKEWTGRWACPDLPGHGASDKIERYGLRDLAGPIAALVRDEPEIWILGHSLVGAVALELASGGYGLPVAAAYGLGIKTEWTDEELARFGAIALRDAPLTAAQLIHNAIFLLNTGHETTSNLIGSALHILASGTGRASTSDEEIDAFVEEVLRFESPNQLGNRRASSEGATIGEQEVAANTPITLLIGSANRDSRAFTEPDRFQPQRRPNRHLAFGAGGHQCAGLSLARIEARIAIRALNRRGVSLTLAEEPRRQRRVRFRGFDELRLIVQPT